MSDTAKEIFILVRGSYSPVSTQDSIDEQDIRSALAELIEVDSVQVTHDLSTPPIECIDKKPEIIVNGV